ncbi:MAG: hypothetical protein COB98_03785 [Flavobacteriaceae bacterium]|nr:MAG: hypothetical protein COB98_03785 [Flavobacteriaceae bacterium]
MEIMDLDKRKYEFIQKLLTVNESLFEQLEYVLNKGTKDKERISIDQYNQEIDAAIIRVENGAFHTQEEVEKIMDTW